MTFDPNGNCTRAQTVTFLWRANGSPAVSGNHQIFASKYFTYLPTEEELKRELRLDEFRKLDE